MICTNLNNLYLQRGMCFDYVERFELLLNDLESLMKLPPGEQPPENRLKISLPWKSQPWTLLHKKNPFVEIPPVIIALQQSKKQTIFKF